MYVGVIQANQARRSPPSCLVLGDSTSNVRSFPRQSGHLRTLQAGLAKHALHSQRTETLHNENGPMYRLKLYPSSQ